MIDGPIILLCVCLSLLLTAAAYISAGRSLNYLAHISAYFTFFAFGPAVNLLLGSDVYIGTELAFVAKACLGFLLAVAAIGLVNFFFAQRTDFDFDAVRSPGPGRPLLMVILLGLILYGLTTVALAGPQLLASTKMVRIAALGPLHADYLLVQLFATATYSICRTSRSKHIYKVYLANLAVYVGYCVYSAERDFVFVLLSLFITYRLLSGRKSLGRGILLAPALLAIAVYTFGARSGEGVTRTSVLNQGSVLFVDTFLQRRVPEVIDFEYGATYVNSFINLAPSFIYSTGFNLAQWFQSLYAPTGTSGYGFSMTGEAYLNFGFAGIPAVLALVALGHRLVTNRLDRSHFYVYLTILFTTVFMYAIRGDSLQLFKTLAYGLVFYGIVMSVRGRRPEPADDESAAENALQN